MLFRRYNFCDENVSFFLIYSYFFSKKIGSEKTET